MNKYKLMLMDTSVEDVVVTEYDEMPDLKAIYAFRRKIKRKEYFKGVVFNHFELIQGEKVLYCSDFINIRKRMKLNPNKF